MSKHTPGNWSATPEPNGLEWSVTADDWFVCCCADMPSEGMAEANARLIASAPDLLEALIILRGACIAAGWLLDSEHADHMDQSRAAIAKATGND